MSLGKQGIEKLKLLKNSARDFLGNNLEILCEMISDNPMDAFELEFLLYGKYKVLLEYEISTFALKLWTGEGFEYLDNHSKEKMIYLFDSMKSENILHNFKVLDDVLKSL